MPGTLLVERVAAPLQVDTDIKLHLYFPRSDIPLVIRRLTLGRPDLDLHSGKSNDS